VQFSCVYSPFIVTIPLILHSLFNKAVYSTTMVIFQLLPTIYNRNVVKKDKTIMRGCQDKKVKVMGEVKVGTKLLILGDSENLKIRNANTPLSAGNKYQNSNIKCLRDSRFRNSEFGNKIFQTLIQHLSDLKSFLNLGFRSLVFVSACPACPGATSLANIAISILFISPGNTA